MEDQSGIKVFGSGPAAMLIAQLLARYYDQVQFIKPEYKNTIEHPVVINTRMQQLLEELCPGFIRTLPAGQFSKFTHADVLKKRFSIKTDELEESDYSESFISLSNTLFCQHLEGYLNLCANVNLTSTQMIRPNTSGAELFFDASGLPSKESKRVGHSFVCLRKSFFASEALTSFELFSIRKCRGGIYPQGDKFDICFFIPSDVFVKAGAEAAFARCLEQHPPSKNLMQKSAAVSELCVIKDLESYISPFYQNEDERGANNTFLVGQSYIFSQPSYSRGLVVLEHQLRGIQRAIESSGVRSQRDRIYNELVHADIIIRADWETCAFKDRAEKSSFAPATVISRIVGVIYRSLMGPLEHTDANYYRRLLAYFQDRKTAREILNFKSLSAGVIHLLMRYRAPEVAQIFFVSVFGVSEVNTGASLNLFFVMLAILFHVLSAYLINDYADHDLDLLNPRKKFISNARNKATAFALTTVVSIVFSAFVSLPFMLAVVALDIISFAYSARPFRLKERVGFSLILHFLMGVLYILVPVVGLSAPLSQSVILIALAFGVILSSGSLLNEYIDAEADRAGGVLTLGQRFQSTHQVWPFYFLHSLAFILLLIYHLIQSNEAAAIVSAVALLVYQAVFMALKKQRSIAAFRNRYRWLFGVCLTACLFL